MKSEYHLVIPLLVLRKTVYLALVLKSQMHFLFTQAFMGEKARGRVVKSRQNNHLTSVPSVYPLNSFQQGSRGASEPPRCGR